MKVAVGGPESGPLMTVRVPLSFAKAQGAVWRRRVARLVTSSLLMTFAAVGARADWPETGLLPVRQFTDRDGLPQNAVTAMAFAQDGALWIGAIARNTGVGHNLPADEVLLDDPFQHFRSAGVIPGALGIDDRDRPAGADLQAVCLRAKDAAVAGEF